MRKHIRKPFAGLGPDRDHISYGIVCQDHISYGIVYFDFNLVEGGRAVMIIVTFSWLAEFYKLGPTKWVVTLVLLGDVATFLASVVAL